MVYVRDVASVRDGNPPQTNIVHVDGNRSVLMMVLKAGAISTLDIIAGIKQKVIDVKDQLPEALKINFIGDQSLFVRGAIGGVANEGVIAALLTSVMILLFLGSWRSHRSSSPSRFRFRCSAPSSCWRRSARRSTS